MIFLTICVFASERRHSIVKGSWKFLIDLVDVNADNEEILNSAQSIDLNIRENWEINKHPSKANLK